jgi:nucleoside-diphosphate-sugar epimerase
MNVLITGANGFIGKHLCTRYEQAGHRVFKTSRSIGYQTDITSQSYIEQLCREKFIDLIVHTAAKPIVSNCEDDPFNALKTNTLGTASVLEAARQAGVKRTIIFETDKVYGSQDVVPTKEDANYNPRSPYELSKSLASTICDFYRSYYSQDVISIRLVNIYGPGDDNLTRIIPATMMALAKQTQIPLYKHAEEMERDFLYVKDLVDMVYLLSTTNPKYHVYNTSMTSPWKIKDLVASICDVLGEPRPLNSIDCGRTFTEIPIQQIDGTRFVEEYGFNFTNFDVSMRETFAYYENLCN